MERSPYPNKHFEWSKLLTVLVLVPYLAVILLAAYVSIKMLLAGYSSDAADVIQYLLVFVAAPLAVAYGFYFWKAKAENLVKCAKELKSAGIADDVAEEIVNNE